MAAEVREFDGPTFRLWDQGQRVADRLSNTPGHHLIIGPATGVAHRDYIAFLATMTRNIRSHDIERPSVRHREKKGAQHPTLRVKAIRALPKPNEHLLADLLGPSMVTDKPARERDDRLAMTSHNFRHCDVIAPGDCKDELGVISVFEAIPRHEEVRLPGVRCRGP